MSVTWLCSPFRAWTDKNNLKAEAHDYGKGCYISDACLWCSANHNALGQLDNQSREHRWTTIMYSIWKIMCFFNIKACQCILLHQIHKIMIFKIASYDPFKEHKSVFVLWISLKKRTKFLSWDLVSYRVLKSLKFSCIKFKALKSLKLYKKVLIMISRGLKFGDGKTRIAIWLNVTIKLQKAMISLNKHERCAFKVRCCSVFTGKTVIFQPKATPAGREWIS